MVALSLCALAGVLAPAASEAHHHQPASAARAYGSCGWGEGLSTWQLLEQWKGQSSSCPCPVVAVGSSSAMDLSLCLVKPALAGSGVWLCLLFSICLQ